MSSFLQKFRGKDIDKQKAVAGLTAQDERSARVAQLPVDVYQSDNEIIIYAQISGTDVNKLDVSIEGENDVITIQGEQHRPEDLVTAITQPAEENNSHNDGEDVQIHIGQPPFPAAKGAFLFEECGWGQFFRQIILPQKIDPSRASAKAKDGVLVLHLPLKEISNNKIRLEVIKLDDHS